MPTDLDNSYIINDLTSRQVEFISDNEDMIRKITGTATITKNCEISMIVRDGIIEKFYTGYETT